MNLVVIIIDLCSGIKIQTSLNKLDYENTYNIEHSKCYTEIHMNTQENIVSFVKKN